MPYLFGSQYVNALLIKIQICKFRTYLDRLYGNSLLIGSKYDNALLILIQICKCSIHWFEIC